VTEEQKEQLYALARDMGERYDRGLKTHVGADVAEAWAWWLARCIYVDVAGGKPLEQAVQEQNVRWREYAREQARKVDDAPKIKYGPSQGTSVISHRWVPADRLECVAVNVKFMVKKILGKDHPLVIEHRCSISPTTASSDLRPVPES